MKDMLVEVKLLTSPLLSDGLLELTTFPSDENIFFALLLHAPQLPASQIASLYMADYHSAVLMTKIHFFSS